MSCDPAPNPVASMRMGGSGPKLDAIAATMAAPGRRGELDGQVPAPRRDAAQQLDHRRRGVGQEPVGTADGAHARRHRRGGHLVDAEDLQRRGRADHVDHGVVRPDLVEVDVLGGRRWSLPSTSASAAKVSSARRVTRDGQACLFDQADDVGMGPHHDVVGRLHDSPGRRHPGAQHGLGAQSSNPRGAGAATWRATRRSPHRRR